MDRGPEFGGSGSGSGRGRGRGRDGDKVYRPMSIDR